MYNGLTRLRALFIFGVVLLFGFQSNVFGINLTEEIASKFQKYYEDGYTDEYLDMPYSPVFSKDPFNDSLKNVDSMSKQLKISGVQYVEDILKNYNCSLSQKKVWAMLYYFVPEFRSELARALKMELGDMNSKNFVYSEDEIYNYCLEYFSCFENNDMDPLNISAGSAGNPMTSCKEFFQRYYEEGEYDEKRFQNLQKSQLGVDKYWNSTTDDSSYDIMMDLSVIGSLLYEEVMSPITPVFYNLPLFSNSRSSLKNGKSSGGSNYVGGGAGGSDGGSSKGGGSSAGGNDGKIQQGTLPGNDLKPTSSNDVIPIPVGGSNGFSMEGGYDKLVEGLGGYRVTNNSSYFGSLCKEEDSVVEPELVEDSGNQVNQDVIGRDLSSLTNEEYEDLIDYMLDSVDNYATLPDGKEDEIKNIVGNNDYSTAIKPADLDKVANEIKNCRKSCEGLRIDQKASCMLMCACGEITSADDEIFGVKNKLKLFDPEEFPGLGPILIIRFCTVPAVDTRFSVGGRKIFSIEEGAKEIFGVTDKLSREGRLGIWTQQYNFLDSTTKEIKIKDTVSFTINVEWVDIAKRFSTQSDQYKKREIKSSNEVLQQEYNISNSLSNNVLKNHYRLVGYEGENIDDFRGMANGNDVRDRISELSVTSDLPVDPSENSHAYRYSDISETLNTWLDEQGDYWVKALEYITDSDSFAQALYAKRG